MDLYEGTIVIRISGAQKPIDVQVNARDSWAAKTAIEAQYGSSFVSWWRGPTHASPR